MKSCKWLLKVPNCTTNEMVYGELGRFPILINRKIRILKYWVKIVNGKACPLVKQMYNVGALYNATLSDNRVINWASLVESLINSLGFGLVWTEQFVANEPYFISLSKQRLCEQYIQQWFGIIGQRSSCMLYKDLHVSFSFADYLNITMPLKHRIALTKNHSLPNVLLSRGRNRLVYIARLCSTCGVLGDEYHCIFECPISNRFRHILPKHFLTRPNMFILLTLFTSTHGPTVRKLAIFLFLVNPLYSL